jgi:hypothetical protein
MAPASKLSKRTPLSDASSDDETSSESGSDSGAENGLDEQETFPELTIDVTKLNPLSPEVIQKQATINIGASACAGPALCVLCSPYAHAKRQSKGAKG